METLTSFSDHIIMRTAKVKLNFINAARGTDMNTSIHIFVGHYGSGKTECAINYAIKQVECGREVAMADLDIVNPYFRTRQQALMLGARGIRVVSSNFNNDWKIDIPGISSEVQSFFVDNGRDNVVDVGGNAVGARVLARFRDQITDGSYEMWLVVNANRYESQTTDRVLEFAQEIQDACKLSITGLINNTHLLQETTLEDILRGDAVVREVSKKMQIPCLYCTCPPELMETCKAQKPSLAGEIVPVRMYVRPEYLMD